MGGFGRWLRGAFVKLRYAATLKLHPGDRPTPPPAGSKRIILVNRSSSVGDDELRVYAAALQTQINRDFIPAWRAQLDAPGYIVSVLDAFPEQSSDAFIVFVEELPDAIGGLGYHDASTMGHVFVSLAVLSGNALSVVISHEVLEMLVDPTTHKTIFNPAAGAHGRTYALEVCDPCRSDSCAYSIGGVLVSDFVLPAFFSASPAQYDKTGKIAAPFSAAPGGYLIYWDDVKGWTESFADIAPPRIVGSRRDWRLRRRRK